MFQEDKVLNKDDESWRSEWKQMPEYEVQNKEAIIYRISKNLIHIRKIDISNLNRQNESYI